MSAAEQSSAGSRASAVDQAVNVQRYYDALRRGAWLIVAIVVVVTGVVLILSLSAAKTYQASAGIVYNPTTTVLAPTEASATERQLATFEALVKTPAVITVAAHQLSEPPATLKDAIGTSVNPNANIITIAASAASASHAAARANAVAQAFLEAQQTDQNLGLNTVRAQLQAEIAKLKESPGSTAQVAALQERISALQINAAGTTSELQIAEVATPPSSASSPRPALDTIIALFVSLFIGVLVVLGRDQLQPRFASPRELGRILNVAVLAGIPYRSGVGARRRRRALAGLEREAYDALGASVRLLGGNEERQRVILVTGATHGEGKTTVSANLARSLARAGQSTLVISGDLRSPTLHEQFQLPPAPGLSECLTGIEEDHRDASELIKETARPVPGHGGLYVLAAGRAPSDPSSLLSGSALMLLFEAIRNMDYTYVLIDSPPALGLGDTQLLFQHADEVLLVARLDRVSSEQAEDLGELIERLQLNVIGLAVVGAKVEISPYYLSERVLSPASSSG